MAEKRAATKTARPVDFIGPPARVRLASADAQAFAGARGVHWSAGAKKSRGEQPPEPLLRVGRDASRTRLKLDPRTEPGEYTAVVELADGGEREVTISVEPRPRLRVSPGELRLAGPPGGSVSARLFIENRGNVPVTVGDALVTGVFDDDGIETAFASTYRMETDDLNKIVGNVFTRLREAHGGLLRLRVVEGARTYAPGESGVLLLETVLNANKLRRGHAYHGVLDIGPHGIAVSIAIDGKPDNDHPEGEPA